MKRWALCAPFGEALTQATTGKGADLRRRCLALLAGPYKAAYVIPPAWRQAVQTGRAIPLTIADARLVAAPTADSAGMVWPLRRRDVASPARPFWSGAARAAAAPSPLSAEPG